MRKLRPGVEREWKRLVKMERTRKDVKRLIGKLADNFFADTPFQKLMRERNNG